LSITGKRVREEENNLNHGFTTFRDEKLESDNSASWSHHIVNVDLIR
jgi:hypothetical protein